MTDTETHQAPWIDRTVPPPAVTRGRPARYPFRYMDVGDSFLTSADGELVAQAARGYARRRNAEIDAGRRPGPRWRFTIRQQPGGRCRVWRVPPSTGDEIMTKDAPQALPALQVICDDCAGTRARSVTAAGERLVWVYCPHHQTGATLQGRPDAPHPPYWSAAGPIDEPTYLALVRAVVVAKRAGGTVEDVAEIEHAANRIERMAGEWRARAERSSDPAHRSEALDTAAYAEQTALEQRRRATELRARIEAIEAELDREGIIR